MIQKKEFGSRVNYFEGKIPQRVESPTVSIKFDGSFHPPHSPEAHKMIDEYLKSHPLEDDKVEFIDHESGPELLVYLALGTAAISLSKSIIDLIVAILKSRQQGIKRGDRNQTVFEIRVRGFDENGNTQKEKILEFRSSDTLDRDIVRKTLQSAISKFLPKQSKRKKSDSER